MGKTGTTLHLHAEFSFTYSLELCNKIEVVIVHEFVTFFEILKTWPSS